MILRFAQFRSIWLRFGSRELVRSIGRAFVIAAMLCFSSLNGYAQRADTSAPVVIQPGAPGRPSRTLPPSTRAKLPPRSQKDVEFMRGMIMHHAQAVQMTLLLETHTENKDIRRLGERISHSQSDEIEFMKRWLEARGEPILEPVIAISGTDTTARRRHTLMPGMLSLEQMEALRNAKGAEFDRLFLTGMIQHHKGALLMVQEMFDTAGGGQDAELFTFATDVDSGQRAEIRVMESMLGQRP